MRRARDFLVCSYIYARAIQKQLLFKCTFNSIGYCYLHIVLPNSKTRVQIYIADARSFFGELSGKGIARVLCVYVAEDIFIRAQGILL